MFLRFVKSEPRFEVLYYIGKIGFYYGLRRSELLGLKWSAINYCTDQIEIRHTVVRTKHQPEHRDTVKSKASHRYLPLLEDSGVMPDGIKGKPETAGDI